MSRPISPVIVTFKALPGVRVQAIGCSGRWCGTEENPAACALMIIDCTHIIQDKCSEEKFYWREVPQKENGQ